MLRTSPTYVQNQLGDMIAGSGTADHLRIYTTIDMDLQRAAYAALTKQLADLDKIEAKRFEPGTLQAALVAMNAKTGEIVAMVGGRDYSKSQLNRAADAFRQPGFRLQTVRLRDRAEHCLRSSPTCDHTGNDVHGRAEDLHV